jgi:hypothetical protein
VIAGTTVGFYVILIYQQQVQLELSKSLAAREKAWVYWNNDPALLV